MRESCPNARENDCGDNVYHDCGEEDGWLVSVLISTIPGVLCGSIFYLNTH